MVDILHRIGTQTRTPEKLYQALTDADALAAWWTADTTGTGGAGEKLAFRFGDKGGFDMEVLEAVPDERVSWRVVDGPEEWIGTTIDWDLQQQDDGWTILRFAHRGWREPVEFMHHCSTKWATYLMSLKSLVETGVGAPAPGDVKICDWD